jgi:hypothetical protein
MNKKLKLLEEIFQERTFKENPVNNLQDIDNLKVLVWTFSKTGTSTLASSFQHNIDGTLEYKNVTHSHHESCWFNHVSKELKQIGFSFKLLIDFINSKGIRPVVIQSYRCPVESLVSGYFHLFEQGFKDKDSFNLNKLFNTSKLHKFAGQVEYIRYLKKTFNGIWTHDFNKEKGFGFNPSDRYDIIYTTIDNINNIPQNIKSIKELEDYHNLTIKTANTHKSKAAYKEFKNNLAFKKGTINYLYDIHSDPLNFFYTRDKVKNMLDLALQKYETQ